jgi:hypothetical protein
MLLRLLSLLLIPTACTVVACASEGGAEGGTNLPGETPSVVNNEPAEFTPIVTDRAPRNQNALQRFWTWSDARVRGLVDYMLPDTQERSTLRFSLSPRMGDFVRKDHIRLPMSLTYGLSKVAEIEAGFDPYFPNPFKDGHGTGAANLRAAMKVKWQPAMDTSIRAATGVRLVHPLSSAPYDFNDGVNRYSFYQTLARPSPWNPNLEGFVNLSYDFITPSTADGAIDEDDPQNDFYQIGAGWLMRKKHMSYGLSVAYAHTTDGVGTSFTTVTPNVIFDVPSRFVFNSPGQWQLGAAIEGKRYGDDNELSVKVRVRWNVDFRKVVKDWREARMRDRLQARNE